MRFLITGAGRGIGRGLTRLLLQRGHSVYLTDFDQRELQATLSRCKDWAATGGASVPSGAGSSGSSSSSSAHDQPARFRGSPADLSDRAALGPLVADVGEFFGGALDVLVNNAFATPHTWTPAGTGMEDGDNDNDNDNDGVEAQWDRKIAVGLTAPFLLTRRLTALLRAGRSGAPTDWTEGGGGAGDSESPGCVVNVASTRAYMAEDDHEAYSAAKAGLLGLTQSMAVSLGHRYRIRVNAMVVGWINVENENAEADASGMKWEDGLTQEDHKWHLSGRVGKVEDIARTVLYLAESTFVTGEEVKVDGGVTRLMVYPE